MVRPACTPSSVARLARGWRRLRERTSGVGESHWTSRSRSLQSRSVSPHGLIPRGRWSVRLRAARRTKRWRAADMSLLAGSVLLLGAAVVVGGLAAAIIARVRLYSDERT